MNDISRTPATEVSLARDLQAVVDDTRTRLGQALHAGREQAAGMQRAVIARACNAGRATDQYVHSHPWRSMGLAAAVALLAGFLLARK